MVSVLKNLKVHPQWPAVLEIHSTLVAKGYKAFLAGGCVRDALLGRAANDLDLATDAPPSVVESLFERTVGVGKAFGVIRVLIAGSDIEVATFRKDLEYRDGRHPEGVKFSSPEEDALRRDFTVNALFYDLEADQIIDYVNGQKDISLRILRTVGEPAQRFSEDYLRIIRGARFLGQLGFVIEPLTLKAMQDLHQKVLQISGERIHEEMTKLLKSEFHLEALKTLERTRILSVLFAFVSSCRALKNGPDWYLWAQFFQQMEPSREDSFLQRYRFSNKEKMAIKKYLSIWRNPESFMKQRQGQKLEALQFEGVRFALDDLASQFQVQVMELLAQWRFWGEVLPKNYVSGQDVKLLKGPDIGKCLKEVLYGQLEGKIKSRQEALAFIKTLESQKSF